MLVAVTVPPTNERGPQYMDQALAAIRQGNPDRLPVSFEYAWHDHRATLLCRFPPELRTLVEGQLYAQYPDCKIERVGEDTPSAAADETTWTTDLRLTPDIFPLKRYAQFEDALNRVSADPVTAILTALAPDTHGLLRSRVEIALLPTHRRMQAKAKKRLRRLAQPFFRSHPRLSHWYAVACTARSWPVRVIAFTLGLLGRGPAARPDDALSTSATRVHDREEDLQAASDKLGRLLFDARVRIAVSGPRDAKVLARRKLRELAGTFGQFSSPRLGSFRVCRRSRPFLLSTEETATLWHPPTLVAKAPAMAVVESRELEAPVTLPSAATSPDLAILGVAVFRSRRERFGVLPDDRRRHVAILGKTGMGKSTLLLNLLSSDIHAHRGVGLIDPHGDLAETVLQSVPKHRTNDVVLFDAGDASHPLSFNVLACPHPEQRPLVASGILGAFKKAYSDSWGPRLEHILRNALLALLEVPNASLVSLIRLLSDRKFRATVAGKVTDPAVRAFWQVEFAGMPPRLQGEAIAPIQNKIGHVVSSPLLRNILGQARSALDLRRVMDEGRVLIVNLSKGRIGEDASALLGSLLVSGMQIAAMSRSNMREADRHDFYLYVDEFQNFATDSFATILSEARKYRLNLTIANQYLAQMEETTADAVFGNVGTLLAFQVGAKDAEIVAEQLGPELTPQDLMRLPRYTAYVRLLIDGQPSRPFSMQTLAPASIRHDQHRPAIIRRYSRQRYARPLPQVEAEIREAFVCT